MGVALPWIFTDSALRPLGMRDTTRHAERGLLAPSIARRAPAGHRLLVRGVPGSLPERVPRSVTRRGPPARARPHRRDGVLRRLPEERRGGALLAAHASRAGERGRRGPHPPLIAALPSVALATGARDRYGRVAAAPVSCASWTRSPEGCEAPQARQRPRQAPELQPRVKSALHEVMYAETREQPCEAVTRFATEYGPKYPKAVATLPAPEPVAGTATRSATCSSRRW